MNTFWLVSAASVAILLGSWTLLLLRRHGASDQAEVDPDWVENFSVRKYGPMARLLRDDDVVFLKSQPGYHPSLCKTLRRERRRVFRSYLNALCRDFDRLYRSAKHSILYSDSDASALLNVLLRQRLLFYFAIGVVELRLTMHALGLGTVDVQGLVSAVEQMGEAVRMLRPVPPAY